jgi:hypothetical protein
MRLLVLRTYSQLLLFDFYLTRKEFRALRGHVERVRNLFS